MTAISISGATRGRVLMTNFVLVHGAWIGGFCWRPNAQGLRKAGHEVYTPTLTGLGERIHLMSPSINLDTHITDIVNVIKQEELMDVVLIGHSYGGRGARVRDPA
jgi:pimeloyl-ACP methyl ester carboxylesterase